MTSAQKCCLTGNFPNNLCIIISTKSQASIYIWKLQPISTTHTQFRPPIMLSAYVRFAVVLVVAVAAVAAQFDLHTKFVVPPNNCASKHKITDQQWADLRRPNAPIVVQPNYMCYIRCLIDLMDLFRFNGLLHIDTVVRLSEQSGMDGAVMRAKAEQCARPWAVTDCEDIYAQFKCLFTP